MWETILCRESSYIRGHYPSECGTCMAHPPVRMRTFLQSIWLNLQCMGVRLVIASSCISGVDAWAESDGYVAAGKFYSCFFIMNQVCLGGPQTAVCSSPSLSTIHNIPCSLLINTWIDNMGSNTTDEVSHDADTKVSQQTTVHSTIL